MFACVSNQHHGYWLLLDVLATIIKLHVQVSKDKLDLQAKIDVVKEMDLHMKVKQLGVNMQLHVAIVLRPLLDLMDFFKLSKTHNMLALMLNPQFKDKSLVKDYVAHASTIEIVVVYDTQFLFPIIKKLCQKLHGQSNASSSVVQEVVRHSNIVFGVGVSEEETCLEQVFF